MKRLLTTMILACAISSSALAGDIPSDGSPAPPPNGMTETTPGDIPISGVAEEISTEALSALLSVFGFLAR